MNDLFKKYFWLTAMVISVTVPVAYADDLFDDSFFSEAAPVDEAKPAKTADVQEQNVSDDTSKSDASASVEDAKKTTNPAADEIKSTDVPVALPEMPAAVSEEAGNEKTDIPSPVAEDPSLSSPVEHPVSMDFPAPPAMDLNVPSPPSGNQSFSNFEATSDVSIPANEQMLGRISSDVFREMAEMERENAELMLQLKREQLRSEIDALKTSNRQVLFDEIERREKMTQARLEWELAQDLKRQDALERRQRAEIRQKQIEAALKREEDRRIEKLKNEEEARIRKEKEEKAEAERKQAELRKKYDAVSMMNINGLKPVLMAAIRPAKIKRTASSRVPVQLTSAGEDLLTKKKAGEALTVEIPAEQEEGKKDVVRESASSLYSVAEIRGTAGTLIAKLVSKKDKATFFAKKETILPTGHTVINIDKDFVMVQIGNEKEMIGFPSAGLIQSSSEPAPAENANAAAEQGKEQTSSRTRRRSSVSSRGRKPMGASYSGVSLVR